MKKFGDNVGVRRVEWVRNTLKNSSAGLRILDAGAGEQQYKPYCSHLQYVAQDFAQHSPYYCIAKKI